VLSIGGVAALMAFTGPHQGLWLPGGLWLLGIALELRLLTQQVAAMNGGAPDDSFLRAAIEPWGWAAAGAGALLMVGASLRNRFAERAEY